MHDDSEVLQRKLLKLLQDLIPNASLSDAEAISQELYEVKGSPSRDFFDSNLPQDASSETSNHHESETIPANRESLFNLGEIPAVQDRFYSLLKHRLQTEIQQNPPLFPWETEIHDYETETVPYAAIASESTLENTPELASPAGNQKVPAWIWSNQLKTLNLPVPMPEKVLAQLFQRCQDVMQSSLLEGAKLVRAVEELFPGQAGALNQLAGLVMTSPARSDKATTPTAGANFPSSYEVAVPPQQMVLSLLAAREIMTSLSLTLSSQQPQIGRQWLTEAGVLTLLADYQATTAQIRIQGNLPCGGSLLLRGNGLHAAAERSTTGLLTVELNDIQPNQIYTLEVRLTEKDPTPVLFTVRLMQE
jgi:hypothetical protein